MFSLERNEAVLKKMLPPYNKSIRELAEEEGILDATLYNCRKVARAEGPYSQPSCRDRFETTRFFGQNMP